MSIAEHFQPPALPALPAPTSPAPANQQTMVLRECAICQSSIYPAEEVTPCASCGLVYHAECWNENFGCASYGCEKVNALAPKEPEAKVEELPPPIQQAIEPLPWNFVLLGASALAMALSSLMYGLPSLFAGAIIALRIWRKQASRDKVLIAAEALCILGAVGGLLVSRFWFMREYIHGQG